MGWTSTSPRPAATPDATVDNTESPIVQSDQEGAAFEDILAVPWYVNVDDLIGGYIVGNRDKPNSQYDYRVGDVAAVWGAPKHVADHIAALHNQYLAQRRE